MRRPRAGGAAAAPQDGDAGRWRGARPRCSNAEPAEIAALLREHPRAGTFVVDGALSERFLEGLLGARASGPGAS